MDFLCSLCSLCSVRSMHSAWFRVSVPGGTNAPRWNWGFLGERVSRWRVWNQPLGCQLKPNLLSMANRCQLLLPEAFLFKKNIFHQKLSFPTSFILGLLFWVRQIAGAAGAKLPGRLPMSCWRGDHALRKKRPEGQGTAGQDIMACRLNRLMIFTVNFTRTRRVGSCIGIYYKTFHIYRTCMRCAPASECVLCANLLHCCCPRTWPTCDHVAAQRHAKNSFTLHKHLALHTSHSTLCTSHSRLHLNSFHLFWALLTSSDFFWSHFVSSHAFLHVI